MTCAEAEELFAEVAGGELDGRAADEARAHAAACAKCGRVLADYEAAIALCARVGTEPLPEGFSRELHRKLVAAGAPEQPWTTRLRRALARRPMTWAAATAFVSALAATGGTIAVMQHRAAPTATAEQASYRVPESKVALVKIDFVAERAVNDVDFEIVLPDGLRFFSGGKQLAERSFRWHGELKPGSNPIPVAVKGPRAGRFRVIAHAVGADLDVTHEVWLEVTT